MYDARFVEKVENWQSYVSSSDASNFVFKIISSIFGILLPKNMFSQNLIRTRRGDLTDLSAKTATVSDPADIQGAFGYQSIKYRQCIGPVKFFSKFINLFFGCFDPINTIFDNKNK